MRLTCESIMEHAEGADAPGRYNSLKMKCHASTQLARHSRRYQPSPGALDGVCIWRALKNTGTQRHLLSRRVRPTDAPGRYNSLRITCHACTQLTRHSRRYQIPSGAWCGMHFGERRVLQTQSHNTICFRDGCAPQTHQDGTTYSRRRDIHVFSSLKTPEGTRSPQALEGVCILESADSTNNSQTTPFVRACAQDRDGLKGKSSTCRLH